MPPPEGYNWKEHILYHSSRGHGMQFQAQRNNWGQHERGVREAEAALVRQTDARGLTEREISMQYAAAQRAAVERQHDEAAQRAAVERQHDEAAQRAAVERAAARENAIRAQAHSSIVARRTADLARETENSLAKGTRLLSHHGITGTYGRGLTESDILTEADRRADNESINRFWRLMA